MSNSQQRPWTTLQHSFLAACLERLQRLLEQHAQGGGAEPPPMPEWKEKAPPPPLLVLCERFGLTAFERDVLLLAAGMELDTRLPALCALARGDSEQAFPTLSLALAALPGASWEALAPSEPLRRWHLVQPHPGSPRVEAPLHVDERIWQYLLGVDALDTRLGRLLELVPAPGPLLAGHERLAREVAATSMLLAPEATAPLYQLYGRSRQDQSAVAWRAARLGSRQLYRLGAHLLPTALEEVELLALLWNRELRLGRLALLVDCHDLEPADSHRRVAVAHLATRLEGLLLLSTPRPLPLGTRSSLSLELARASRAEQGTLWQEVLDRQLPVKTRRLWQEARLAEGLALQFDLDRSTLEAAAAHAAARLALVPEPEAAQVSAAVREAVLAQLRGRLAGLAERLEAGTEGEGLAPAEPPLAEVELGLRRNHPPGLRVLLAGPSATGPQQVAAALARRVELEPYRFHLGALATGQPEAWQRLEALLEAASAGGVLLLLEGAELLTEATAAALLQRLEGFQGPLLLSAPGDTALPPALARRGHVHVALSA